MRAKRGVDRESKDRPKVEEGPKVGDGMRVKRVSRVGTRADIAKRISDSESAWSKHEEWMAYKSLGPTLFFHKFPKHM